MIASSAISIITIVKNGEKSLPRAVDSVFAQQFKDFEYIIVNDGSTDGTGAIVDDYAKKDARVKPIHMPMNVGRAMARNAGLDAAKGEYIFFLDADDYIPETALADLYEVGEKDKVDIVFGKFKAFDGQTGRMKAHHYTDHIVSKERRKFRLDDHLSLVNNHSIIGRLYRREMLEKNDLRFSTVRRNGEDVTFAFYTAFFAKSMSIVSKRAVYFYNIGNFLATASKSKLFDARDNLQETMVFTMKHGSDALIAAMKKKVAHFAGDLRRARKVYGSGDGLYAYLSTLVPLVKDISKGVANSLPAYPKRFCHALLSGDYDEAIRLFKKQYVHDGSSTAAIPLQSEPSDPESADYRELREEIEKLNSMNHALAHKLDALYASMSWRLTRPLRRVAGRLMMRRR